MEFRSLQFNHFRSLLILVLLLAGSAGCNPPTNVPAGATPSLPNPVVETATSAPPTPTTVPLALVVNDEPVSLAEFEAELARLQSAEEVAGAASSPDGLRERVLDELIERSLLAQAAFAGGFKLSDEALQARTDDLAAKLGGPHALADWQARFGYTAENFQTALRQSAAAAWQRDQIYATVPVSAEQVHIRQILVYNQADAERAQSRLVPGADFATLAFRYDPVSGGDLGWFPRGFLTSLEVEEAAFALQEGEISPLIESALGYHVIQLIEHDPQRPLSPETRLALQKQAVRDWLDAQRLASQVTINLP